MPETGPQGEESPRVWVKLFHSIVAKKREQVANFKRNILVDLKNKSDNYRAQFVEAINDLPSTVEKEYKDEMLKLVHQTRSSKWACWAMQDGTSGYKYVSKERHCQMLAASKNTGELIGLVVELFIKLAIRKPTPQTFVLMAAMVLMYHDTEFVEEERFEPTPKTKEERYEIVKQIKEMWKQVHTLKAPHCQVIDCLPEDPGDLACIRPDVYLKVFGRSGSGPYSGPWRDICWKRGLFSMIASVPIGTQRDRQAIGERRFYCGRKQTKQWTREGELGGTRDPGGLKKDLKSILETCKRQRQLDTSGNSDDNIKRQCLQSDHNIRIESPSQIIRQLQLPPREAMDSTATASDMSILQLQVLQEVQLLPQANIKKGTNNAGKGKGKCKGNAKQGKCKGNANGKGRPLPLTPRP